MLRGACILRETYLEGSFPRNLASVSILHQLELALRYPLREECSALVGLGLENGTLVRVLDVDHGTILGEMLIGGPVHVLFLFCRLLWWHCGFFFRLLSQFRSDFVNNQNPFLFRMLTILEFIIALIDCFLVHLWFSGTKVLWTINLLSYISKCATMSRIFLLCLFLKCMTIRKSQQLLVARIRKESLFVC